MKTSGRHFFGIDLGTSSCSIAYVTDDPRQRTAQTVNVEMVDVTVDEEAGLFTNRVPSVVFASQDPRSRGGALFGDPFPSGRKKKDARLRRRYRDYFSSVKSDLGTLRVYTRSQVPGCRTPAEVTAVILDRLRGVASEARGGLDLRKGALVVTVPASFSVLARKETLEAVARAGFEPTRVRLLDEPVAALLDLLNSPESASILDAQPRNLLVFDYGAGTCDVALLRVRLDPATATGLHVENLAISSYHRLGGDNIDARVMGEVVWPQICSIAEQAALPLTREREVEDTLTGTVARRLKEQMCREVEKRVRDGSWADVDAHPVRVLVPVDAEFEVPELGRRTPRRFEMDSAQFTAVMAPFLSRPRESDEPERTILFPVEETLRRAGLTPEALDAVVLHGGSSLNPFVRRLMKDSFGRHDLFQNTRVVMTPEPLVSVARGAAISCYWREARGVEIVRPIMPEDFGVVLRDGRQVPLIAAGTPLPFPDADGVHDMTDDGAAFSVPTDRAAAMLVPFYTGTDARPRLAGTIKVPLPAGVAAGTPVRITARVEADKTLKWWFRIGDGASQPAPAVDDPWSTRATGPDERRLLDVRRTLRDAMAGGRPVTQKMLVDEANALRLAGDAEEALLAIEDCIADNASDAHAHNIRGLLLSAMGRKSDAIHAYSAAMRLMPDSAVFVANAGYAFQDGGSTGYIASIGPLRTALEKDPTLAYAYIGLARAYRATGDETRAQIEYKQALEYLRREVERRPSSADGWERLSSVYQALGDYRRAAEARTVLHKLERDGLYEGDSAHVIAGPVRKPITAGAE